MAGTIVQSIIIVVRERQCRCSFYWYSLRSTINLFNFPSIAAVFFGHKCGF